MLYTEEQTIARVDARVIAKFLGLAGVAALLPFFIHLQWITGPIINAILILILFLVGIRSALVVCLIPSLMALAGGLLPAILAPVIPFIMISNVIFVLSIEWIYNQNKKEVQGYWLGVLVGAALKFLFLLASVNLIGRLLIKQELTIKVAQMMSWTQFATAVAGGLIAWLVLRWLKRF
ncbi:MAG: ECF transporter S component [Patescibacteria group bacterium]|nr:ECF transporter S component [Patescibacteria group bacterium]